MDTTLPIELLEHIALVLYTEGSFNSIKTLSLTNHYFCQISQPLLFRSIILECDFNAHYFSPFPDQFLSTLQLSPHLIGYIKELTIQRTRPSSPGQCACTTEWLSSERDMPFVTNLLARLQKLVLPGKLRIRKGPEDMFHERLAWSTFSKGFRMTLKKCLLSTTALTDLDVTGIHLFPADFISCCHSLRRLSVSILADKDWELDEIGRLRYLSNIDESMLHQGLCVLNFLHLEQVMSRSLLVLNTLDRIDMSQIQTLSINAEIPQIQIMGGMDRKWDHLKHLRLSTMTSASTFYSPNGTITKRHHGLLPDFSYFPALHTITLHNAFAVTTSGNSVVLVSPIPWTSAVLRKLSRTATAAILSNLALQFSFENFSNNTWALEGLDWKELTTVLTSGDFEKLLEVEISVQGLEQGQLDMLKQEDNLAKFVGEGRGVFLP